MKFTCFSFFAVLLTCVPLTAHSNAIGDADRDLFQYIHEDMKNRFLDVTLPVVGRMGDGRVYLGVSTLLCAFGNEKMAETGKLAVVAFIEAGAVTGSLQQITGRPRPLNKTDKTSFPSGHATFAFTMATVAGYEYPILRIPLYVAAFGTALSRIYLGKHYPGDVIAGAVVGTLAGMSAIHFKKPILRFSF